MLVCAPASHSQFNITHNLKSTPGWLQDGSDEVHNEAAGFADLAHQLVEAQKARKMWW